MPSKFTTVQTYIRATPAEVQPILEKVRALIRKTIPSAEECISYGMPSYTLHGKPVVYFGAWKHHLGFYATPTGHAAFKKEMAKYTGAKGSVKFPLDEPIPYALIEKMVRFRMREVNEGAKKNA